MTTLATQAPAGMDSAQASPGLASEDRVVVEAPARSRFAMLIKRVVQAAFLPLVAPRLAVYLVNQFVWGKDRAFLAASEGISQIPGMRGVYARQAFYQATLAQCGADVYFGWSSVFAMPAARVGEGAYIGRRCHIGYADIGPGAMLADGVHILSGGREHRRAGEEGESHRDQPQQFVRVSIGAGAWIGASAVIMADVGAGAIVGAGAVVNKPIPAHCVAVGVPARPVKS